MPKEKGKFKGFGYKMKDLTSKKAKRRGTALNLKGSTFLKSQSPIRKKPPKRSRKRAGT